MRLYTLVITNNLHQVVEVINSPTLDAARKVLKDSYGRAIGYIKKELDENMIVEKDLSTLSYHIKTTDYGLFAEIVESEIDF